MFYNHGILCGQRTRSVDIEHALIRGTRSTAGERVVLPAHKRQKSNQIHGKGCGCLMRPIDPRGVSENICKALLPSKKYFGKPRPKQNDGRESVVVHQRPWNMFYKHGIFYGQGTRSVDIEHALIQGTRSMAGERVQLLAHRSPKSKQSNGHESVVVDQRPQKMFGGQRTRSVDMEHGLIQGTRSMAAERVLLLSHRSQKLYLTHPKVPPETLQNQTERPPENIKTLED